MSYNILGINPFHNGSVCLLSDGKVVYYLEEERLTRDKNDANPFRVILDVINKFKIDEVVIGGIDSNSKTLGFSDEDPFYSLIRKYLPEIKDYKKYDTHHHHLHCLHAFYNSGFDEALGIVIDAGGSLKKIGDIKGHELDSIFSFSSKNHQTTINPEFLSFHPILPKSYILRPSNIARAYSFFTYSLGFKHSEEGKTMGLSSYGKFNPKIPKYYDFKNYKSDINYISEYIDDQYIRHQSCDSETLKKLGFPNKYRIKRKEFTEIEKDLAWSIQDTTQQVIKKYVKEYTKKTGLKKVVCSGGVFLNCVANYYLTKEFPDIEFYFEPIAHDGGTAIGAAYLRWKELNPSFKLKKQNKIYYGPRYSEKEMLDKIKKYL